VAPGFEEVEAEFRKNFAERGEVGAACAVYHRGEKVVDLWGGYRDADGREPWEEDTMVLVFSTTKGLAAMVVAVAHSRGLFELDEPVATYWPQFAQAGKGRITVRQLLAHQAGLSAIDEPLDVAKLADLDFMAEAIAKQRPAWEPGTRHGYHGLSLGWYQNELIRRVDPQHRSLGTFLQDEIAKPLGVEFYIGLPSDIPASRVADVQAFHPLRMLLHMNKLPPAMVLSVLWPWSLTARSLRNPKLRGPGEFDSPAYRKVEFPSGNGIGTARAIAKAYGVFATGGHELGITPETFAALTAPPIIPSSGPRDVILRIDTAYSMGLFQTIRGDCVWRRRPSVWCPRGGRVVRIRRPGRGGRLRVCDEQNGDSTHGRPAGASAAGCDVSGCCRMSNGEWRIANGRGGRPTTWACRAQSFT
jgi:CubicO group peptidase (beta-lactamase class C family)